MIAILVAVGVLVWFLCYVGELIYVWWTGKGTITRTPNGYIKSGYFIVKRD